MMHTRAAVLSLRLGWLSVIAAAVALRLVHLSDRSIWYDEASSWQTARYGWTDFLRSISLNVHLPLYYLLLKGWMAVFGGSAAAIREMSVFFGIATVVLMGLFGRELFRASAACREECDGDPESTEARFFGLAVGMLVALSPVQVFASIEARMYTMGTTFAALSCWLLLRNLRTGGGVVAWLAYGLALTGLVYSHHWGLFSAAAQALFLGFYVLWLAASGAGETARRLAVAAGATGVMVALMYLPAYFLLRTQLGRVQQDYWIRALTWEKFAWTFSQFVVPDHGDVHREGGWYVVALVAAASLYLSVNARRGEAVVLASALLPIVFAASVSTMTPIWVGRYFRFAHLFILATLALAVWRIGRGKPVLLVGALACSAAGLLYANVIFWSRLDLPHNGGMRAAAATIMGRIRPGESIVATDVVQYVTAKFYVHGKAPIHLVRPPDDMFWGWHLIRPDDLISLDELRYKAGKGIWLIGTIPIPVIAPEWDWGERPPSEIGRSHYYIDLHTDIYVHYYKSPGAGAANSGARAGRGGPEPWARVAVLSP